MHCYFCNGFYSPTFGEPVCSVCHTFLFPDFLEIHISRNIYFQTQQEIDDGDSGNDEPIDPYYNSESREHKEHILVVEQSLDEIQSGLANNNNQPADIVPLPTVEEQLKLLSIKSSDSSDFVSDITRLPPEVMLTVLSYLDELSLWSVGNVCRQWRKLLDLYMHPSNWGKYTVRRWPLFKSFTKIDDWFEVNIVKNPASKKLTITKI